MLVLLRALLGLFLASVADVGAAPEPHQGTRETLRVGILAYGSVAWELAAAEATGLKNAASINVVPTVLATGEAAKIALQGDTVDLIVADWIWVARQRAEGADFTFVPYSSTHGALVVAKDSGIRDVGDLKGKRLGVVGGGLDKNWLMLKALVKRRYGWDAEHAINISFGAPPLLNQQLLAGRLDAVLDYWHYAAKLEVLGFRVILDGRELLRRLEIDPGLANLGFVFRERWARSHGGALRAFIDLHSRARRALCEDDVVWRVVAPNTGETDPAVTDRLRQGYCAGAISASSEMQASEAGKLYRLLQRSEPRDRPGGAAETLPSGTFWDVR